MNVDPVNLGLEIIREIGQAISEDAANYMKSKAPEPRNVSTGPGSESTGALKHSIRYWNVYFGKSHSIYHIGPAGSSLGNNGQPIREYAPFADQGRGEIFVPPQGTAKAMAFTPKHGNPMVVHHVSKMEGWDYIGKTIEYIKNKYGGQ